jgi:hypothetical protein
MTPKEKAEELLSVFAKIIPASSYEAYEGGVRMNFDLENAKQCALIHIEEILNNNNAFIQSNLQNIYWQQVKQEIENYDNF